MTQTAIVPPNPQSHVEPLNMRTMLERITKAKCEMAPIQSILVNFDDGVELWFVDKLGRLITAMVRMRPMKGILIYMAYNPDVLTKRFMNKGVFTIYSPNAKWRDYSAQKHLQQLVPAQALLPSTRPRDPYIERILSVL